MKTFVQIWNDTAPSFDQQCQSSPLAPVFVLLDTDLANFNNPDHLSIGSLGLDFENRRKMWQQSNLQI